MAGYLEYYEMLDAVKQYYGAGSDQWVHIAQYGITQNTIPWMRQVPGVSITTSTSGKILGWDYNNPFETVSSPASVIDSNVQTGTYGAGSFNAQLPATAVTNPSTGVTTMTSGAKVASTGATLATIADRTFLALAGVSMGTKLGVAVDRGLYSLDPEWWDTHYPTINPETWDDIASSEGGKNVIRALFGLQGDDTTMYLDERLLAYTYMTLLANGGYSDNAQATFPEYSTPDWTTYFYRNIYTQPINYSSSATLTNINNDGSKREYLISGGNCSTWCDPSLVKGGFVVSVSNAPVSTTFIETDYDSQGNIIGVSHRTLFTGTKYTKNNSTNIYYYWYPITGSYRETVASPFNAPSLGGFTPEAFADIGQFIYNGQITPGGLDGITPNPEAGTHITPSTLINPTTGQPVTPNDDPADVLQALKNHYPELFDGSIYEDVPQPDGTTDRIRYIPVPYPDTTDKTEPTTDTTPGVDPQTNPQVNPETRPQPQIDDLVDTLTSDPTPPDTGDGDTPPAVIPAGTASALYSIYNPSQSELNSFGAWLWSSNFVDQLLKVFNDPMQAIIGLHKVFAQPGISGTSTIHVGYLDSGVSSNVVGNQYTTIDCGSVNVSEYFGNVFDYDPFTQVYIYLPFVGIEKLDTGDVMRGNVGVKYHVDVLTGACLAEIKVTRDGSGGILYTYAGNCAVQYPISSGSYMGIVASMASIAGGVVGTIASGGALAPVAMGAVSGALNAHTRVQHSGGFSGNAGAMGVKKPYLIITRPQTALADNFPAFDGYPANKLTTISACSGFVRCETCHIESVPATDAELNEIETLLKEGIIV